MASDDVKLGRRIYVIDDGRPIRIAQRTFDRFFHFHEPTMKEFSGRTLELVIASYSLDGRKPKQVIQIDTMRVMVTAEGVIDRAHQMDALRLAANNITISGLEPDVESEPEGNVVNAKRRFDRRREEVHSPKLSGPVHKQILDDLFK
jgi:hypothetical protein